MLGTVLDQWDTSMDQSDTNLSPSGADIIVTNGDGSYEGLGAFVKGKMKHVDRGLNDRDQVKASTSFSNLTYGWGCVCAGAETCRLNQDRPPWLRPRPQSEQQYILSSLYLRAWEPCFPNQDIRISLFSSDLQVNWHIGGPLFGLLIESHTLTIVPWIKFPPCIC